jgi:cell division protein FtsI (penicillin-binding protein 3)
MKDDKQRTRILSRMFLVLGLVVLLPAAIAFQILRVQFVKGDELRSLWNEQAIDFISVPAKRGNIYDNTDRLLATTSVAYKVAVDPHAPGYDQALSDSLCHILDNHSSQNYEYFKRKIDLAPRGARYIVLARGLGSPAYRALNRLPLRGLIVEEQYERRYNYGSLAAHALGYVNHQMEGMIGLEASYNDYLKGKDGLQQVRRDRKNRIYAYVGAPKKKPVHGYSLHTTIDAQIQAIAEEELAKGVRWAGANYGTAIVLNPKTGSIKAMANYPTYDPNRPASSESENRRNYAIADMIEPGSTFKLVTAIAALEQNKVSMEEQFETPENGRRKIYGQWMRDHDPLGTLNFEEVIQRSSNIATSEIAMRLEPETFYQYARNLGFGTPTNVDLPNEETGFLRKPYNWSQVTLPWISIGYEVQVTPLQLAQAYAAFANGGKLMRPFVVEKVTDSQGNVIQEHQPMFVREVAQQETLERLYPIFEGVVSDSGTAEWAQVDGLPIAGKTGTAQKLIDGRYQAAYRASFVGFYPVEDPQYVTLVILDEPTISYYGGFTAGPIFKGIASRIAGLDPDIQDIMMDGPTDSPWAITPQFNGLSKDQAQALLQSVKQPTDWKGKGEVVIAQQPAPGDTLSPEQRISLTLGSSDMIAQRDTASQRVTVPDLDGLNMRQALWQLQQAGLTPKVIGSGTVYAQYPKAGAKVRPQQAITIRGRAKSLETLVQKSKQTDGIAKSEK